MDLFVFCLGFCTALIYLFFVTERANKRPDKFHGQHPCAYREHCRKARD